MDIFLTSVQRI